MTLISFRSVVVYRLEACNVYVQCRVSNVLSHCRDTSRDMYYMCTCTTCHVMCQEQFSLLGYKPKLCLQKEFVRSLCLF